MGTTCTKPYGVLKSVKSLNAMKIQEKKPRIMINTMSVFLSSRVRKERRLVGHIPVELSSLTDYFLKIEETNRVIAEVTGKRKREVGRVVPAKFIASTMNRRFAHVLDSELNRKKEKYAHFELFYKPNCCKRYPVIKSVV